MSILRRLRLQGVSEVISGYFRISGYGSFRGYGKDSFGVYEKCYRAGEICTG